MLKTITATLLHLHLYVTICWSLEVKIRITDLGSSGASSSKLVWRGTLLKAQDSESTSWVTWPSSFISYSKSRTRQYPGRKKDALVEELVAICFVMMLNKNDITVYHLSDRHGWSLSVSLSPLHWPESSPADPALCTGNRANWLLTATATSASTWKDLTGCIHPVLCILLLPS